VISGVDLAAPFVVLAVHTRVRINTPNRTQLAVPAPRTLLTKEVHRAVLDDRNEMRRTARGAASQRPLEEVVLRHIDLVVSAHHLLPSSVTTVALEPRSQQGTKSHSSEDRWLFESPIDGRHTP
jgi:hypothetical protein